MPRQPTEYDAVLISPPEPNITFYLDTGEPLSLPVWRDTKTMAKLVKCDLCGRFMPLSGANLSTTALKKHRGRQTCQEYFNKYANHDEAVEENPQAAPLTFVNQFQAGRSYLTGNILQGIPFYNLLNLVLDSTPADSGSTTPNATWFSAASLTPQGSPSIIEEPLSPLPPSSPPAYLKHPQSDESEIEDFEEEDDDCLLENACTGQLIKWEAGSVWETYAYSQHEGDAIGWTPIGYEGGNYIRLQSKGCQIFLESPTEYNRRSCDECFGLLNSRQLMDFIERSKKDTVPHAPWKYLNARQLKNMIVASRKKAAGFKLKVNSATVLNHKID
jgi:hypothetical protein